MGSVPPPQRQFIQFPDPQPGLQQWPGRFVGLESLEEAENGDGLPQQVVVAFHRPEYFLVDGMSGGLIVDAQGNAVSLINSWTLPPIDGYFPQDVQQRFGLEPDEELIYGTRFDLIVNRFGQANYFFSP